MESYAAGERQPALLDETIGTNFERTVAAHADREALVEVASGRRWTWPSWTATSTPWPAAWSPPGSGRVTAPGSGRRTAPSGPWSSTPQRSAWSWST